MNTSARSAVIVSDSRNDLPDAMVRLRQAESGELARPRWLMPWQSLMIDVTGNVQPCAYRGNYTNFSTRPSLGNINKQTLEDIWNGAEARHIRKCLANGDLDSAGCGGCLAVSQGQQLGLEYDPLSIEAPPSRYASNLALKIEEILAGESYCHSAPTVLFYTPDHRCNLACLHCYQNISRHDSVQRKGAEDELLALVPYLSDVVAGGGEPLIIPFWRRFLASEARNVNPYLRFATTTNATVIRDDVFDQLTTFNRLAMIISMDGATKATFEKIRQPAKWEPFLENVLRLRKLCADRGHFFSINISTMKSNLCELAAFIAVCTELEAPYNYQPVVSYPAEQSLRCFNNPHEEMRGWRDSLARAALLLESQFFPAMEEASAGGRVSWSSEYKEVYRGHISALEGLIPWHLLDIPHYEYEIRLPDFCVSRIEYLADNIHTFRKNGRDVLVLFFRDEDAPSAESHYYAKLGDNLDFSIWLPDGNYRVKAVEADYPLGIRSEAWSDVLIRARKGSLTIESSKLHYYLRVMRSGLSRVKKALSAQLQ